MKDYKIQVAVAQTPEERERIIARLAVEYGFARIASDGRKLIRRTIADTDLSAPYFIMCGSYDFKASPLTNARLVQLAAQGILILVGSRTIPKEYEIFCTPHY